jgi:hypothetical protein
VKRSRLRLTAAVTVTVALSATLIVGLLPSQADESARHKPGSYEVWAIDQSDTVPGGGGMLYVFDGRALTLGRGNAQPKRIDLGSLSPNSVRSLCLERTGTAPQRPHMLVFDETDQRAALAFVASGHVVIFNAVSRKPIECIDTGVQAHAVWPDPNQKLLYVANQNDKKFARITTDWKRDEYALDSAATLDLANGTTPSGALRQDPVLRPDNAPICPRTSDEGRLTFITLRGGGMFVVDGHASPMKIVAEYDKDTVHANGCGGIQADDTMYINSGAGALATNPDEHDLYAFDVDDFSLGHPTPPNQPAPNRVYTRDDELNVDSHGVALSDDSRYLWVGDRSSNDVTIVDTLSDRVVNRFELAGDLSDDPAPDLFDRSPDGEWMFASLRGPNPQSGGHAAFGSTPGVGVLRIRSGGRDGELRSVAALDRMVGSLGEVADIHAIRVRVKTECGHQGHGNRKHGVPRHRCGDDD